MLSLFMLFKNFQSTTFDNSSHLPIGMLVAETFIRKDTPISLRYVIKTIL